MQAVSHADVAKEKLNLWPGPLCGGQRPLRTLIRPQTIDGVSICGQKTRRAKEAFLQVVVVPEVFGGERVNLSERYDYPVKPIMLLRSNFVRAMETAWQMRQC